MAQIIDGKVLSQKIRQQVKDGVAKLQSDSGIVPGLATVLVGDDPASHVYVKNKNQACAEVGMVSRHVPLTAATSEQELLDLITKLNHDPAIHGILVQLPLPQHIHEDTILEALDPKKDVDGFHPLNVGNLCIGKPSLRPCTPSGIMKMFEDIKYDLQGKHAVVIGRSQIVGKPVALMLLEKHATVTICHSRTQNIGDVVRAADVVVAAVGRAGFVKGDWIREGAVVIDVGINRGGDKKLVGDVDFAAASKRAAWITPVPGGVGPMTIAMLLSNTLAAARHKF